MADTVSPNGKQADSGQPWTVGFYGPFRILTSLDEKDKEIDIDDRAAVLNVEIEMMKTGDLELVAKITELRLDFDFAEHKAATGTVTKERENILLDGKESGPLFLIGGKKADQAKNPLLAPLEISPGPANKKELQLTVQTGHFSMRSDQKVAKGAKIVSPDSASPGRKIVNVKIDYELAPKNPIKDNRTNAKATMQFVVAPD
jgi:hypothetical protein